MQKKIISDNNTQQVDAVKAALTALIPHCSHCNNHMVPISKTNRRIAGGRTENTLWECTGCSHLEEEVRTFQVVYKPDETWAPDVVFQESEYAKAQAKIKAEAATAMSGALETV